MLNITSDINLELACSIFLFPLLTCLIIIFFSRFLFKRGDILAVTIMGICTFFAVKILLNLLDAGAWTLVNESFSWIGDTALQGGILIDRLTCIMLVIITLVSFLSYLFSTKYMHSDIRYNRYFCYLLLSTSSVVGLVLSNNLLFLFIFWELLGLYSYLLIGHWYEKPAVYSAAIKAFIITKVGDVGMLIGILICYTTIGSLQFIDIFNAVQNGTLAGNVQTIFGLCLFFAAMGKSAQFPLHIWLPDTTEGPTPISALIHTVTMVAAGVYLLARFALVLTPDTLIIVAYTGAITALLGAILASIQDDIKRVLAYSTISQLGLMFLAIGVGAYTASIFYLGTHAFFKAGLFLAIGAIVYGAYNENSMAKMGGLYDKMPHVAKCYLICVLALVGFPLTSGFWSREVILNEVVNFSLKNSHHSILLFIGIITILLTSFYMFRQFFLVFTGDPRDKHIYNNAIDANWRMLIPLYVLAFFAFISGGIFSCSWFERFYPLIDLQKQILLMSPGHYADTKIISALSIPYIELSPILIMVSVTFVFIGLGLSLWLYFLKQVLKFTVPTSLVTVFNSFNKLNNIIPNLIAQITIAVAKIVNFIDIVILDTIIISGFGKSFRFLSSRLALVQTGYIRSYFLLSLLVMIILAIILTN